MMFDPPLLHGNLVPIVLCTKDDSVIYVDKDLEQLHELVVGGKVTKYRNPTLVSVANRWPSIEMEVRKKEKKDQGVQTHPKPTTFATFTRAC
jgi:hypothetical protein